MQLLHAWYQTATLLVPVGRNTGHSFAKQITSTCCRYRVAEWCMHNAHMHICHQNQGWPRSCMTQLETVFGGPQFTAKVCRIEERLIRFIVDFISLWYNGKQLKCALQNACERMDLSICKPYDFWHVSLQETECVDYFWKVNSYKTTSSSDCEMI